MFSKRETEDTIFKLSEFKGKEQLKKLSEILTYKYARKDFFPSIFTGFGVSDNKIAIHLKEECDISEMTDWLTEHNYDYKIDITGIDYH